MNHWSIATMILALVFAGCSTAPDREVDHSIAHLSAYIGDQSFVAKYGRAPAAEDEVNLRIQTHLLHVEALLRSRDIKNFSPAARRAREKSLDDLHSYALAMRFPEGESVTGYLPTFIDDKDNRCAVAHLIEHSAGLELARAINEVHRNDFVRDMDDPALLAWADTSGLDLEELALIQPSYPPRRQDTRYRLSLRGEHRLGEAKTRLTHAEAAHLQVQWGNHNSDGTLVYEVEGLVGSANFEDLAYRALAWASFGGGFRICDNKARPHWAAGPHAWGLRIGGGVDEAGADVGRALIVPMDAFYSFPSSEHTRLALHAGPVWNLWGKREQGLQSALAFRWKRVLSAMGRDRWDLHLALEYERKAGANFAGLQLGLGKYRDDGFFITE